MPAKEARMTSKTRNLTADDSSALQASSQALAMPVHPPASNRNSSVPSETSTEPVLNEAMWLALKQRSEHWPMLVTLSTGKGSSLESELSEIMDWYYQNYYMQ
jgi:hypothetical protein